MGHDRKWHWPEYIIEASGLCLFMISAGVFGTLLEYPGSPVRQAIDNAMVRRCIMGVIMGLTAIALIYSPWGKQSGAHFNPAVTLTFWRLGKVRSTDALGFVVAQFTGGLAGVFVVIALLGIRFSAPPVSFVATLPGMYGTLAAFFGELLIAFVLMSVVLYSTNKPAIARYTGLFAGLLVATYITVEAPVSGMSMNPARSFASAAPGGMWHAIWIYFLAPPFGMLLAAQLRLRLEGINSVSCAKLHHQNNRRCIFCLWQHESVEKEPVATSGKVIVGGTQ